MIFTTSINVFFLENDLQSFVSRIIDITHLFFLRCHDKMLVRISHIIKVHMCESWFVILFTSVTINPLTFKQRNFKYNMINLSYLFNDPKIWSRCHYRILFFWIRYVHGFTLNHNPLFCIVLRPSFDFV